MGLNYGPIFRRLWTKVHQRDRSLQRRFLIVTILFHSGDIRDRSANCEVVRNRAKKHFFRPPYFSGEGSQILDLDFKTNAPISDHVAKFRGDRPRDRGDLALNKKKEKEKNSSKTQGPRLRYRNGRP